MTLKRGIIYGAVLFGIATAVSFFISYTRDCPVGILGCAKGQFFLGLPIPFYGTPMPPSRPFYEGRFMALAFLVDLVIAWGAGAAVARLLKRRV
jgi:hypothetical protein